MEGAWGLPRLFYRPPLARELERFALDFFRVATVRDFLERVEGFAGGELIMSRNT
jgi:hypothetical protein